MPVEAGCGILVGTLSLGSGSWLTGEGEIQGNLVNRGTVTAGKTPHGLVVQGDFVQDPLGRLVVNVDGAILDKSASLLHVVGEATLAGVLDIQRANNYVPDMWSTYPVVVAAAMTGHFDTVTGGDINPEPDFTPIYGTCLVALARNFDRSPIAEHEYNNNMLKQRAFFDAQEVSGGRAEFRLYDPAGRLVLVSNATPDSPDLGDFGPVVLSDVGVYRLGVYAPAGESPTYDWEIHSAPLETWPLVINRLAAGNIAPPGTAQQWEFTVTAGNEIALDVQSIAGTGQRLAFTLVGPDGRTVWRKTADGADPNAADVDFFSIAAGTYRLFVEGAGDDVAAYRFVMRGPESPRIHAHAARGETPESINSAWFYFDQPMNTAAGNFDTAEDLVTFRNASADVMAHSATWQDDRTLVIRFAPQPADQPLFMLLGPSILSAGGVALDQDGDLIVGETPDDQYAAELLADTTGPRVFAAEPSARSPLPFDHVTLHFSEAIDPSTFSLADLTTFTGPAGVDLRSQVTDFVASGSQVTFYFAVQNVSGQYVLALGPQITDAAGNLMDQDRDGTFGEAEDGFTLTLIASLPDLAVESVANPLSGIYGDTLDLAWTVRNDGGDPAEGRWWEYAYLSSDREWDLDDVLVGTVLYDSSVRGAVAANGGNYRSVLRAPMPGILPGDYYVIVRSNLLRGVGESDFSYDSACSANAATFDLPTLVNTLPVTGEIDYRESLYYRFEITAATQSAFLEFNAGVGWVGNELYVRRGALPTRQVYDARSEQGFNANQWLALSYPEPGTYYVLAAAAPDHTRSGLLGAFDIRLDLYAAGEFHVFDKYFGQGGTAGNRTIEINGVNFDRTLSVSLVCGGALIAEAVDYYRVGPEKLYATFDLTHVAPGTYEVQFRNGTGRLQCVGAGLDVLLATVSSVCDVGVIAPPATKRKFHSPVIYYPFTANCRNNGLNDVPTPILTVSANEVFGKDLAAMLDIYNSVAIPEISPIAGVSDYETTWACIPDGDTPPGIMMPGQLRSVTYQMVPRLQQQLEGLEQIVYSFDYLFSRTLSAADWEVIGDQIRLPGMSDSDLAVALGAMKTEMASKGIDFGRMLAANANLLADDVSPDLDWRDLAQIELAFAWSRTSPSITGYLWADSFEVSLSGRVVEVRNLTSGTVRQTYSLRDGRFALSALTPGEYEVTVSDALMAQRVTVPRGTHDVRLDLLSGINLGVVVKDHSGLPIQSATIEARWNGGSRFALTDVEGHSQLAALPSLHAVDLLVWAPGCAPVIIQETKPTDANNGLVAELRPESTIAGILLLPAGVSPEDCMMLAMRTVSDTVTLVSLPSAVGAANQFAVRGLGEGTWTLYACWDAQFTELAVLTIDRPGEVNVGTLFTSMNEDGPVAGFRSSVEDGIGVLEQPNVEEIFNLGRDAILRELDAQDAAIARTLFEKYLQPGPSLQPTGPRTPINYGPINDPAFGKEIRRWAEGLVNDIIEKILQGIEADPYWTSQEACAKELSKDYSYEEALALAGVTDPPNFDCVACRKEEYEIPGANAEMIAGGAGKMGNTDADAKDEMRLFKWGPIKATLRPCDNAGTIKIPLSVTVRDAVDFFPDVRRPTPSDTDVFRTAMNSLYVTERLGWTTEIQYETTASVPIQRRFAVRSAGKCCEMPLNPCQDPESTRKQLRECCKTTCGHIECDVTLHCRSLDPNDMRGPIASGDLHYVGVAATLDYMIRFENDPKKASAPAAVVRVTQQLDPDLDWTTFRLGVISFGETVFDEAEGKTSYANRLDMRDQFGIYLDVTAGLDLVSGEAFWELKSIDPETGEVPSSPLVGFLPPNANGTEGQGYLTYSINPKAAMVTGTRIDALAAIVFDENEPMDTPAIFNTIDGGAPASSVSALPATSYPGFLVQWSGVDDTGGSGIASYDVYVSTDSGPFVLWLADTDLTEACYADAEPGHTYAFYSTAVDWVGNAEAVPALADAQTVVIEARTCEVRRVDVSNAFMARLSVQFTALMKIQPMIDDGSIFSAVSLTRLSGAQIDLHGGAFTYRDSDSTLFWSSSEVLASGHYHLTLDGTKFSDSSGAFLSGGEGGNITFALQAFAASTNVEAGEADLRVATYSVPTLADWNSDGLPDLVVGEKTGGGEGRVRVYLNTGTIAAATYDAFFYVQSEGADYAVSAAGCLGAFPRVFDWDGDGRKDLLVGAADGRIQLLLNTNTNADPEFGPSSYLQVGGSGTKIDIDVGERATFDVCDWNNDARYDLVVGSLDGRVRVFLNEATSGLPDFVSGHAVEDGNAEMVVASGRASVAVADLDADGRKDLVIGNTDGQLLFYANVGTDAAPTFGGAKPVLAGGAILDLEGTPRSRPSVGDFDQDGTMDILLGSADGLVRWYRGAATTPVVEITNVSNGHPGGSYSYIFDPRYSTGDSTVTAVSADHSGGSVYGETLTFTATVSANLGTPTGFVQFLVDGSMLGQSAHLVNGRATISTSALTAGHHTLVAVYSADTLAFHDSTGLALTQEVARASLTVQVDNQSKTYGASLPQLTGTVNGAVAGDNITASFTTTATSASDVTAGGYSITPALNDPDHRLGNYNVTLVPGILVITKADQAIQWLSPAAIAYGTRLGPSELSATVNVTGPSTAGTLTYDPPAGTLLSAGPDQALLVTVAATQNYNSATAAVRISVGQASTTTVPTASSSVCFGQSTVFDVDVASSGGVPTGRLDFFDQTTGISLGSGFLAQGHASWVTTLLSCGLHSVLVRYSGDSNFLPSSATTSITVLPSIYVLDPTASGSLTLSGDATITVPGRVVVNSSSASAVRARGTAELIAGSIEIVGGYWCSRNAELTPAPTTGMQVVPDPLAGLPTPAGDVARASISLGRGALTIDPGVYHQIKVFGTGVLTMNPGIYTIAGGGVSVRGRGSVVGRGVMIYNTGSNFPLTGGTYGALGIGGQSQVDLTPPTSGTYVGISIYQSPDNSRGLSLTGRSTSSLHGGVIYAPNAQLTISGGVQSACSAVVKRMSLSGSAASGNAPGLYDPVSSTFYLTGISGDNLITSTLGQGAVSGKAMSIVGDWDGNGGMTPGLYDANSSTFYLSAGDSSGSTAMAFGYGAPNAGWLSLVGDWDGDGVDGIGLYDPQTSIFYLTDTLGSGYAQYCFGFGVPGDGWTPFVGDWNGDGASGIGLYDPRTSVFYLTETLATGYAECNFGYGQPGAGWQPIVGDWDGDGAAGVGLYDPQASQFYLTNAMTTGYAEYMFGYGEPNAGWTPLVGDWDGDDRAGVGLYAPSSSTFYLTDSLLTGVAQYSATFGESNAGWQPLVGDWPNEAGEEAYGSEDTSASEELSVSSLPLSAAAVDQIDLADLLGDDTREACATEDLDGMLTDTPVAKDDLELAVDMTFRRR